MNVTAQAVKQQWIAPSSAVLFFLFYFCKASSNHIR